MNNDPLNEREFELINIVGGELGSNQRDLSKQMSLSLGMTNMLIKRLVSKGYIRIRQLNKRKVEYLLTPKGFAEKMRKSVKYTIKTINSIGYIKDNLKSILRPIYDSGERSFVILGKSDFAHLVEAVFNEMGWSDCQYQYVEELVNTEHKGTLLIAKEETPSNGWRPERVVNLIHELAKFHNVNPNYESNKG